MNVSFICKSGYNFRFKKVKSPFFSFKFGKSNIFFIFKNTSMEHRKIFDCSNLKTRKREEKAVPLFFEPNVATKLKLG